MIKVAGLLIFSILVFSVLIACQDNEKITFQKYYAHGKMLYEQKCSHCHQADGKGLAKVYPPLANSDFMMQNKNQVICLVQYGAKGEMKVNDYVYNMEMPAYKDLTVREIATILTFIYNEWGNQAGLIGDKEVKQVLERCEN